VSRLVLIVVAAAWAAVLLPPLLRSRMESRPDTSVSSFRRQLTSLQRSTPGRDMSPMRSMARPLAGPSRGAQLQRPMQAVQPIRRSSVGTMHRYDLAERRPARAHYAAPVRPMSTVKQRRQNVLMGLAIVAAGSGLLAMTTTAMTVRYVFALSVCVLIGYVYLLVQTKRADEARTMRDYWQQAA
jgi:hypothetical protein